MDMKTNILDVNRFEDSVAIQKQTVTEEYRRFLRGEIKSECADAFLGAPNFSKCEEMRAELAIGDARSIDFDNKKLKEQSSVVAETCLRSSQYAAFFSAKDIDVIIEAHSACQQAKKDLESFAEAAKLQLSGGTSRKLRPAAT